MVTINPISKDDLEELKMLYDNGFQGTKTDLMKMNEVFDWMKEIQIITYYVQNIITK